MDSNDQTRAFDVEKYVRENSYPLSLDGYSDIGLKLRCIDDRASNSDDRTRDVAIPGSGLGLVMDALGGFELLRKRGSRISLAPKIAVDVVERALGAVVYHSDEKCAKERGIECGGCGHCNATLADPQKYLLSQHEARYFLDEGLADITQRLVVRGMKPALYAGSHAACAVIVVRGEDLGISSVAKSGECVYVYHSDIHEKMLALIAREVASFLRDDARDISEESLTASFVESARARLSVTLGKLARDLPKFSVQKEPELRVVAL